MGSESCTLNMIQGEANAAGLGTPLLKSTALDTALENSILSQKAGSK